MSDPFSHCISSYRTLRWWRVMLSEDKQYKGSWWHNGEIYQKNSSCKVLCTRRQLRAQQPGNLAAWIASLCLGLDCFRCCSCLRCLRLPLLPRHHPPREKQRRRLFGELASLSLFLSLFFHAFQSPRIFTETPALASTNSANYPSLYCPHYLWAKQDIWSAVHREWSNTL